MRIKAVIVPIAALAIGLGSFSAEAAQRDRGSADRGGQRVERSNRGNQAQGQGRSRAEAPARQRGNQDDRGRASADRGGQRVERSNRGNQSQDQERPRASAQPRPRDTQVNRNGDQERPRASAQPRPRDTQVNRNGGSGARDGQRNPEVAQRNSRGDGRGSRDIGRGRAPEARRDYDRGRSFDRGYRSGYSGGYSRNYYAPRLIPRRSSSRHYYGSGGHLSLYFGIGSGYRYGSLYSGRVYGYRGRVSGYGNYQYYGDVRLQVSPRDAAVYVDGYYAGIVDDFDGFFQRLTLEVGPHEIEIEAPGLESQVFDVYVDTSRTVDLHADLLR